MKNKWNRICRGSRAAHPRFYKELRTLDEQRKRGEIPDAQRQLAIVRQLQNVIGDRPQARTFRALKKLEGRLAPIVQRRVRALKAQNV